jgi:hypothetical protein
MGYRLVGVKFVSSDELDAAIDWLWTIPALREMERWHCGYNTMCMKKENAEVFQKHFKCEILEDVRE